MAIPRKHEEALSRSICSRCTFIIGFLPSIKCIILFLNKHLGFKLNFLNIVVCRDLQGDMAVFIFQFNLSINLHTNYAVCEECETDYLMLS